jgi:hypothetical protein
MPLGQQVGGEIIAVVHVSRKVINAELERHGFHTTLLQGDGYFYFRGGEAADWLDRTVPVPTLQSLTLEQWIEQFRILKQKNRDLLKSGMAKRKSQKPLEAITPSEPVVQSAKPQGGKSKKKTAAGRKPRGAS